MKPVPIPPVGELVAQLIPFHVLFDVETLSRDSDVTRFFLNPRSYADGHPKHPLEQGDFSPVGQSLAAGQRKVIRFVSIQVLGATESATFEVSLLAVGRRFGPWRMPSGHSHGVRPYHVLHESGLEVGRDEFQLVAQEQFVIEVKAPEKFRGAYAKVSLHGPFSVAL